MWNIHVETKNMQFYCKNQYFVRLLCIHTIVGQRIDISTENMLFYTTKNYNY